MCALVASAAALLVPGGVDEEAAAQCVEPCTVIHEFTGEVNGDFFGFVSDDVFDLDGDGVHDLIMSSTSYDSGLTDVGRLYVYSGATGGLLFPPITGVFAFGQLGRDVDPAFDVDNDDQLDVISGAPFNGPGRAFVFSGLDGSLVTSFTGEVNGDWFGLSCIGLDDIDGDGFGDVAVSAPQHASAGAQAGRVYVYSGQTGALICFIDGEGVGDLFGTGLARIGDIDGDGLNDFCVGARDAGPGAVGRAYVYTAADCLAAGPVVTPHWTLNPPGPAIDFARFFIDGGDMNGDTVPDIYISDFSTNRAHVFSGADGTLIDTILGSGGFGIGRFVGDVTGDGRDDLFLASWIHPSGGTQAGRADLFSGLDSSLLDSYVHNVPFAQFGYDANGMGDVDGDGTTDYLVTAANDGPGKAYLLKGNVRAGDLDGDGLTNTVDFLVLLGVWGPCDEPCLPACFGDINADCTVDTVDFLILLGNWST